MAEDLVYDDGEYDKYGPLVESFGSSFEARHNSLKDTMTQIKDNAIQDGWAKENIELFVTQLECMNMKVKDLSTRMKSEINTYSENIDAADEYIYN
jgi:translation initiation factor 2 alpha subunit (eIF-2alpha)